MNSFQGHKQNCKWIILMIICALSSSNAFSDELEKAAKMGKVFSSDASSGSFAYKLNPDQSIEIFACIGKSDECSLVYSAENLAKLKAAQKALDFEKTMDLLTDSTKGCVRIFGSDREDSMKAIIKKGEKHGIPSISVTGVALHSQSSDKIIRSVIRRIEKDIFTEAEYKKAGEKPEDSARNLHLAVASFVIRVAGTERVKSDPIFAKITQKLRAADFESAKTSDISCKATQLKYQGQLGIRASGNAGSKSIKLEPKSVEKMFKGLGVAPQVERQKLK